MFSSFEVYENWIYVLPNNYSSIESSSVVLIRRGRYIAVVQGELHFQYGIRLRVYEELIALPFVEITGYSYDIWQNDKKLYWYDSQPHPNDPTLASTHPHHKHVHPNIKQNRIPAPNMSFEHPNLPALIQEIEMLIAQQSS
jgi:hypothetical protein